MRVVFGAGDYCLPVVELLGSLGLDVDAVADDSAGVSPVPGVPRIGREAIAAHSTVYVAIGNATARRSVAVWLTEHGHTLGTAVHPSAYVSPSSHVGPGCIVHVGAFVWSGVELGMGVLVSPHACVAHHATVDDYCLLSMSSKVGSHAYVGSGSTIGIGSTVSTGGIRVGRGALVGAGAVVVKDVPEGATVVGNPAKVLATGLGLPTARVGL